MKHRGGRDRCAGCAHDERDQLNSDLVARVPLRSLEAKYGISKTSLLRHRAHHLPAGLVAVDLEPAQPARNGELRNGEVGAMASSDDVAAEARGLYDSCRSALMRAEAGGNPLAVALAAREARASLDLLGRSIERLEARQRAVVAVVDIQSSREWETIRTIFMEVTEAHDREHGHGRAESIRVALAEAFVRHDAIRGTRYDEGLGS